MSPAPAAYALCGAVLAVCTARIAAALRPGRRQPRHDQVRLTLRQRAAWVRFRVRFGRDLKRQLAAARLDELSERLIPRKEA